MAQIRPLPVRGDVFLDTRGQGRTMRLSWHEDHGVLVLSLWREGVCTGSFRLARRDLPWLLYAVARGFVEGRRGDGRRERPPAG